MLDFEVLEKEIKKKLLKPLTYECPNCKGTQQRHKDNHALYICEKCGVSRTIFPEQIDVIYGNGVDATLNALREICPEGFFKEGDRVWRVVTACSLDEGGNPEYDGEYQKIQYGIVCRGGDYKETENNLVVREEVHEWEGKMSGTCPSYSLNNGWKRVIGHSNIKGKKEWVWKRPWE